MPKRIFSNRSENEKLVQSLQIAAPCDVPWESMTGDNRKRLCGQCKLNVYNVASMSSHEVAELFRESQGNVCLQLYRRKDGTILTDNCPVGLRKIRDRLTLLKKTAAAACLWLGLSSPAQAQTSEKDMRHFFYRGKAIRVPVDAPPSDYQTSTTVPQATYRTDAFTVCTERKPAENFLKPNQLLLLFYSSVLSVFASLILIVFKGSRVSTMGAMLLAIWALTGFLLGIMSVSTLMH